MRITGIRLPSHPFVRRAAVATLTAVVALGAGPAIVAQEPGEREHSVRVMVLGDGEVLSDEVRGLVGGAGPRFALPWGGAWLGVELINLNEPLRTHFGVPAGSGVLVSDVVDGSPAARSGVQVGDILTRVDGDAVTTRRQLRAMMRRAEAGDPVDLEFWRDGRVETGSTTLDERPRPTLEADSLVFLRGREDLDGDGELDAFLSPDRMHETIQEYFDGDEWKERHERVQRFLHERRPDMKALEERLEALKTRLMELEEKLEARGVAEDD